MIKVLPLISLLFAFHTAFAQQSPLDSMLALLHTHTKEDKEKLTLLNEIAFEYNFTDPDKGLEIASQAISLAKKLDLPSGLASSYSNKGVNFAAKGDDTSALNEYQNALSIHTQNGNKAGMARIFNNMAIIHVGLSNYAEALEYHRKSLSIFEELSDRNRMANALNNTGVVYLYLADYPKALEYYLKALTILESLNDEMGMANNFSNIGIIYKNLSAYPKALEFQEKALQLYEKTGNDQGRASTLGNIGVVYDKLNKPDKALEYYQKGLSINNRLGNKKRIASDLTNIGVTYQSMGNYSTSMDYFQRAFDLYQSSGDKNSMAIVLNQLGELYTEAPDTALVNMGINPSARFIKSKEYLEQGLLIAKETGAPDRQSESWAILSNAFEKQKEFEKALDAYKQHIIFRDSIHNVENERKVARNEMQFEFEKKEALASAEMKRERTIKNAIIGSVFILLVAAIFSFIFYKRKLDADKKKKVAEFNAEVAETEMKALRLQMNPHFIFNSLNSISDYITRNNVQEADRYLAKFAKLMRTTLENSEQKEVDLATDLEALELYLQLEAFRLNNKFSYKIIIDESVDVSNTIIPPMLLQPFVENSILHGIAAKKEKGNITIRVYTEQNTLHCIVEDDGVGRAQTQISGNNQSGNSKKSMGMKITKARIDILNKIQKSNANVEITDIAQGTRATITLPLHLSF